MSIPFRSFHELGAALGISPEAESGTALGISLETVEKHTFKCDVSDVPFMQMPFEVACAIVGDTTYRKTYRKDGFPLFINLMTTIACRKLNVSTCYGNNIYFIPTSGMSFIVRSSANGMTTYLAGRY